MSAGGSSIAASSNRYLGWRQDKSVEAPAQLIAPR